MIRTATPGDAAAVCDLYNPFVEETTITFEEQAVGVDEMRGRIEDVLAGLPWLVYEQEGAVVGYAYGSRWRTRSAYRFSAESTIYVRPDCHGRGIGRRLYGELIEQLRGCGIHRVIGGIALPNDASMALHESLGFKHVARFEEVGYKFGRWIDVGYWQLGL